MKNVNLFLKDVLAKIKNKARLMTILLGFSVAALMQSNAHAKTYIIGVENVNLFPFYNFNGDKPEGYLVDLLQKYAKDQGFDIEFRVMPPSELWVAYLNNDVDFRMPDNLLWKRSRKRELNVTYSAPLVYFNSGVVSLIENKDAPLTRMGTIKGFTAWSYKDEVESGEIKLVEESGTRGLIEGLFSGRTDGVYYNVEAFIKQVQGAGYAKDSVVFRRELKTSHSLYMMSSIHHGDKIYALNQFLRDNRHWVRERKQYYGIE